MTFKPLLFFFFSISIFAQKTDGEAFDKLNQSNVWQLQFKDKGTKNWQSNWFLDGHFAQIKNTPKGMIFNAGPEERNDTHHAVLWTKDSFKGNLKMEFNFCRKDTETKWAIILYLQATGTGIAPYVEDISKWNHLREIPAMKTYFNNMKALHISYASFDNNNTDKNKDYIRVRQYPVEKGQNFNTTTEIPSPYFETGLFRTGKTYKITIIKTNEKMYFKISGKDIAKLFSWNLKNHPELHEGRIGLRQMATRSALYKDISVYTMK
ncbi:DUF1961 family protein [Flavobacterium daejeonense]|uniref:DUF1961 family protein n=1 Tax=Flavobacterium daejeonense TaxID=350893 RepID=UPI00047CBA2A|nr:DUF1961 family protein [Flavobacterium daejeonense]